MEFESPAPLQGNPLAPPGFSPIIFDTFTGINTQASRPGIADTEMYVCDGFMPLGKNNLRTLPGVGDPIYTASAGIHIVFYDFGNIGDVPICIVFLSDGSIQQVNTSSLVGTQIAPAGTVMNPSVSAVGITQWGNQFIIIVANQSNGYWIWDGTNLFIAGNISPLVTVVNSGKNYTSSPFIVVNSTLAPSGTVLSAVLDNDFIQQIVVSSPGAPFGVNEFIDVIISGGGSDDTAYAFANIGPGGGVESIAVLNAGTGYNLGVNATLSGGGGTGASILLNIQVEGSTAAISSVTIINPGTGFTSSPTVTLHDVGGGSGALFAVNIFQGQITSITVVSPGTGYITPPTISLIGDGTGGKFQAQINSSGQLTGITVLDGGQGYTKALVHFSGGNNAAEAIVEMMPFGIQGTDAETFLSRVWIANGSKFSFTAPESITDFSSSSGGGTIQSTDSFLRNQYTVLRQTNGFLYLIADSSENYISGVTTSGSPPTTTFNNQNADPEIGTSWPATVDVLSRNIVFANSFGAHISYGGAVTKISDNLDGIYNSVPNFGGFIPSAAKAIIYGKRIWMLLLPVIDQISGQQVNKLFMWNGKTWFTSQQDITLNFVQHQELNSVITAYGTDGNAIYPLFQNPSTGFTKTVQSKLWDTPGGYMFTKASSRLWGLVYFYSALGASLSVSIDNENGTAAGTVTPTLTNVTVLNVLGIEVVIKNALGNSVSVVNSGTGVIVFQPDAIGQTGELTGITLSTNAADMAVISLALQNELVAYRG